METPKRVAYQVGDALVAVRDVDVLIEDQQTLQTLKRREVARVAEATLGPSVKVTTENGLVGTLCVTRQNKQQVRHVDELAQKFTRKKGLFGWEMTDGGQHKIDFKDLRYVDPLKVEDIEVGKQYATVYRTSIVAGAKLVKAASIVQVTSVSPINSTAMILLLFTPSAAQGGYVDLQREKIDGEIDLFNLGEMILKEIPSKLNYMIEMRDMCSDYDVGQVYTCLYQVKMREKFELLSPVIAQLPAGSQVRVINIGPDSRRAYVEQVVSTGTGLLGWVSLTMTLSGEFLLGMKRNKYYCDNRRLFDAACKADIPMINSILFPRGVLEREQRTDGVDARGKTVLHYAAQRGHVDLVSYLLRNCTVNPQKLCNKQDDAKKTALHYAASFNPGSSPSAKEAQVNIVSMLCEAKAEANALDWKKRTPLLLAADTDVNDNLLNVARELMSYGAEITEDRDGRDVFELLRKCPAIETKMRSIANENNANSKEDEEQYDPEEIGEHLQNALDMAPGIVRTRRLERLAQQLKLLDGKAELVEKALTAHDEAVKMDDAVNRLHCALQFHDIESVEKLLRTCGACVDERVEEAKAWVKLVGPLRPYISECNKVATKGDTDRLRRSLEICFSFMMNHYDKKASTQLGQGILQYYRLATKVVDSSSALQFLINLKDTQNHCWHHRHLAIFCLIKCDEYHLQHPLVEEAVAAMERPRNLKPKKETPNVVEEINLFVKGIGNNDSPAEYARLVGLLELAKSEKVSPSQIHAAEKRRIEMRNRLLGGRPSARIIARVKSQGVSSQTSSLKVSGSRIIISDDSVDQNEFNVDGVFYDDDELINKEIADLAQLPACGVNTLVTVHGSTGSGKSSLLGKVSAAMMKNLFLFAKSDSRYRHKISATAVEISNNSLRCLLADVNNSEVRVNFQSGMTMLTGTMSRDLKQMSDFSKLMVDVNRVVSDAKVVSQLLITVSVVRTGRDRTRITGRLSILDLSLPTKRHSKEEAADALRCVSHYASALESRRQGSCQLAKDHQMLEVIKDFFNVDSQCCTVLALSGEPRSVQYDNETLRLMLGANRD